MLKSSRIRRAIYTTNTIESLNSVIRKAVERGVDCPILVRPENPYET